MAQAVHLLRSTNKSFCVKELHRQLDSKRYQSIWELLHKLHDRVGQRDQYKLVRYNEIMYDMAKKVKTYLNENHDLNNIDFSLEENGRSLLEIAEIGQFKAEKVGFIIYIWSRHGEYIPHIHIGDADTYPKCEKFQCCLKLQTPEYFPQGGKYTDRFNAKQIDSLIEFLHGNDEDGDPIWRYILKTWNINNSHVKIPLDTPIPDYTQLNK